MKKLQKTFKGQKFIIVEKGNGTFQATIEDKYGVIKESGTFQEIGMFVFEMSNNSDIGTFVNHLMCEKFERNFA